MGGRGGGGEAAPPVYYAPVEPTGRAVSLKESQRENDRRRQAAGAASNTLGRNTILASILGESAENKKTLLGG